MIILLGFTSPVVAAFLAYRLIRQFDWLTLFAFSAFACITTYFAITTPGPEGPFYRIYVLLIATLLFIIEIVALQIKRQQLARMSVYLCALFAVMVLLLKSNGVS